jgi:membrane protein implicated in regulation of membrane protease activity
MPWWGWLVIGAILMGAELMAVDAAFYLMFIGFSAVVVGLLGMLGVSMPVWGQWVAFGIVALVSMVLFRKRLYTRIRGNTSDMRNASVGKLVQVTEDVAPGRSTRVEMHGSYWTARNTGGTVIPAMSQARVVATEGMSVNIVADEPAATPVKEG